MVKKIKPRMSLFTQEEIKETVIATKVEANKTEHASATIEIDERPVTCKKCGTDFTTKDTSCYECFKYPTRVVVYCPKCMTSNKILKELTFPSRCK